MRNYLLKLFAHEHWANHEVLKALHSAPAVPPRTQDLLAHIVTAHAFWDRRLHGVAIPEFNFWPSLSLNECSDINEAYARKWPEYVAALPELIEEQIVTFTALDGASRQFRVVDILLQLHAHSIHHRAQIMLDMHAAGLEPVSTDYLLYCRLKEKDYPQPPVVDENRT